MTITRNNVFVPEVFTEAIRTGFTGLKALYGTGAAIVNDTLPSTHRGGDVVTVPYFSNMGEAEDVAEGAALTPKGFSQTPETASVVRSGIAFDMTRWAQLAASEDPYADAVAQQVEAIQRRADKALIDAALTSELTHTVDSNLTYDAVIDARSEWGDELDDVALMVVHSKTLASLLKLKDEVGRPLATDAVQTALNRFVNIPVMVSDRLGPVANEEEEQVYRTLLIKKNALAFWYAGQPRVSSMHNPLTDSTIVATNVYWTAHLYKKMPGKTKPGVIVVSHRCT